MREGKPSKDGRIKLRLDDRRYNDMLDEKNEEIRGLKAEIEKCVQSRETLAACQNEKDLIRKERDRALNKLHECDDAKVHLETKVELLENSNDELSGKLAKAGYKIANIDGIVEEMECNWLLNVLFGKFVKRLRAILLG